MVTSLSEYLENEMNTKISYFQLQMCLCFRRVCTYAEPCCSVVTQNKALESTLWKKRCLHLLKE